MIIKLLTQIILASTLLQIFPVDAGDLERLTTLPVASNRLSTSYSVFTLPNSTRSTFISTEDTPIKKDPTRLGVVTSAVSAIVVDRHSGSVLFEKNIEAPRSIGSITKLMTALVFLQTNPDLNSNAVIESEDIRLGGVQHIPLNETVTAHDLLYASLISSDNSATAAIVRLSKMTYGDFIAKMNETAAAIGMRQTQFVDPAGLSAKDTSVVYDLALLVDYASKNEIIRDATQRSSITIYSSSGASYTLNSTDELLDSIMNQTPYKILTAKTGFLPEAGYCLGTLFNKNGNNEIIVVVLGSDSDAGRFHDVKSLGIWTYDVYEWTEDIKKN